MNFRLLDGHHDVEYCNLRYLYGIEKIHQKPELVWLGFCKNNLFTI